MAGYIKTLRDSNGDDIIPRTQTNAVTIVGGGTNLDDKITSIDNAIDIIEADIGDVDTLTTTSKIVVGAINELDSEYLVTDSVTGTVYRWNIAIADGVPSINFTEVI